ncbi:MAG: prolipoprotein diacylglyceryl transferase [Clostridia bacterium]|nr:prolipoprotein diacylglyceryl transferase [Clostridia bacterium]
METIVSFFRDHILTYSVFAALGILATFGMSLLLCVKREQNWVRQLFLMIGSLLGLVLGAKLFGIVSYATYLMRQGVPVTFEKIVFQSGIVFYGGLLGYFGSFWLLSKYLLPKRRIGRDIVAVTTPLFHGFARIGCYCGRELVTIDGVEKTIWHPCCYGIQMDNAFCSHFWENRLPVQLFESAFNFLLFAALLIIFLKETKEERRGWLVKLYLFAYAVFRFIIEFFRDDAVRGGFGSFSFSQVVSIAILIGLVVFESLQKSGVVKPLPLDPYDPGVDLYRLGGPKHVEEPIVFQEDEDEE